MEEAKEVLQEGNNEVAGRGKENAREVCLMSIGMPHVKREGEEIDAVYSDDGNYEPKRLQMCIECVPTCRIMYMRIWYKF